MDLESNDQDSFRAAAGLEGAAQASVESESRFREIFNVVSDAIFIHDAETGRILEVNKRMLEMYGLTHEEALASVMNDLSAGTPPYSSAEAAEKIRRARIDGPQTFEWLARARDGRLFWVEVTLRFSFIGGQQRVLAVGHDISKSKRAEAALRESEFRWKFALESAGDGVWDWNVADSTVYFSKRWKEMLGFSEDEIGNSLDEWEKRIHPDDKAVALATVQAYLDGKTPIYLSEHRVRCKDGAWKWILDRGMVVSRSEDGKPLRMIGTHADITWLKQAETELRIAAAAFESQDGVVVTDANNVILRVNRAFTEITGYSMEEAVGQTPRILKSDRHDAAFYSALWENVLRTGVWHGEIWNRHKNGEIHPERLTITAVKGAGGETTHYVSMLRDISEQKRVQQALEESEALMRAVMKILPVGVWITDAAGKIIFGNEAGQRVWAGARYVGIEQFGEYKGWWLDSGKPIEPHDWAVARAVEKGEVSIEEEIEIECFDGTHKIILNSALPLRRGDGSITGSIIVNQDITRRKQAEDQARNLAFYDTLTQLPNRRMLNDRMHQAMASSKRSECYCALLFLDLDNFKPLNDRYGHAAGDLLLKEVAHRICSCVREMDTIARFGGDEFVVLLSELHTDKAESTAEAGRVAEKIRAILAEPYVLKVQQAGKAEATVEHRCTTSIGAVLFINHEDTPEDILKWADMAMYQAKEEGRNMIRFDKPKG